MNQRGRPTPGAGSGDEGWGVTRHRVAAAVGWPKSAASVARRHRLTARAVTPELSAANCRRREAVIERREISATTAPRAR